MTAAFGKSANFAAPSEGGAYSSDVLCYFSTGYLGLFTGNTDKCFFRPGPTINWGSCTAAKVIAYNTSGIQLGTAIFLPAQGADWISSNWDAPFATVLSSTYYLGVIPQASSLTIVNSGGSFECNTAAGTYTYASPPTTIAPGSDTGNPKAEFNVYADGTPGGGAIVVGSLYARQRPVGRGPQMNRSRTAFKASYGSNTSGQVLLQLFSAPGVPLANTPVTLWTAPNNEGAAAIDGPMFMTTDSQGYVLLQNLTIRQQIGEVRCLVTGDPTRSRNFTVIFP